MPLGPKRNDPGEAFIVSSPTWNVNSPSRIQKASSSRWCTWSGASSPSCLSLTFLEPEGLSCDFFVHLLLLPLSRLGLFPLGLMPKGPFCFTDHDVTR